MTDAAPVREIDVAAVALRALESQWTEHWPEVPSLSGRVDIVGRCDDDSLHAVECKTSASLALCAQAAARISERVFDTVLVVVGQTDAPRRFRESNGVTDIVKIGLHLGFGVGRVWRDTFSLELPPRPQIVEAGPRAEVKRALNDIHRACASAAGGQSSAYWTVWKQGIHELEQAVAAKPGLTTSDLRYALKLNRVLYWQNHMAQVRTMAEQSQKVRAEFAGGQYRYFPAAPPAPEGQ